MAVYLKSQNVRGLQDPLKRRQIFHSFNLSKYNIFLLQETHSNANCEQHWKNEWGGEIFFSHGTTNSRGVCILLKNNFSRTVFSHKSDSNGRFTILDIEINNLRLLLCSIYGPNRDEPHFFLNFIETLENFDNSNYVIAGDWNLVLNTEKDKKGGIPHTNSFSRDIILSWMEESDLVDIWRHGHPEDFKFTWKRLRPYPGIFCRLDFVLMSFGLIDKVKSSDIAPGLKSDHSAPVVTLFTLSHEKGPGYWKLNTSLLNDIDYIESIKNIINDTALINSNANPSLLWDTIKLQIRGFSLQYASRKKKSKNNIIQVLEKKLNFLEEALANNYTAETEQQIVEINEELNSYLEEKTKGAMIRSRCRWYEHGEKCTKYFLNLEKRNFNSKNLDRLEIPSGNIITNPKQILHEQKTFYQKLYKTTRLEPSVSRQIPEFLNGNIDISKVSEELKMNLDIDILENELCNAIKNTANGKAPGLDGLPIEFYKVFWLDIKEYFLGSINYSYQQGELSISQKQGIISLIPKKDKNPLHLKNWRPLTLLNADYKIIAKTIANRIKTCIHGIIHQNQTGFLKNRFIGENIVKALSIIEYAEEEDLPALIMFVDYEKAFDSVEWDFVYECLDFFNFGNKIIEWVRILYKNISSCIINNGALSEFFTPSRGVRQGCPLSPYLFILTAEIFAISIRKNEKIKGINVNDQTSKIDQYADDTFMAFLFDQTSLDEIVITLDKFQQISGLKVNYDKTEILRIGSLKNSDAKLYTQKSFKWTNNPAALLGVEVGSDLTKVTTNTFQKLIRRIENVIKLWSSRQITLLGRIVIIKTLLVSQFIYRFAVLPSPIPDQMKQIDRILNDYMWNNKKHFINKNVMINSLDEGGLDMVDIYSKNISIKCKWIKKLIDPNASFLKSMACYFIPDADRLFWSGNLKVSDGLKLLKHNSVLWKSIIQAWCIYNFSVPNSFEQIAHQQLWYNSFILIDKKPFCFKQLYSKGIVCIKDIINDNGHIMSAEELKTKYDLHNNHIMSLNSLIGAVPQQWKITLIVNYYNIPIDRVFESNFQKVFNSTNVSKSVYKDLVKKKAVSFSNKITEKWNEDTNQEFNLDREFIANSFKLIITSTNSPKHRAFQFRLIHRILVTNKSLYEWKIRQSDLCSFCNLEVETLYHLLWDCTIVKELWNNLFRWLEEKTDTNIVFNCKEALLGMENNIFIMYNAIFIISKQYIYSCRCLNKRPNIECLINLIKYHINIEKYIATKNGKLTYHNNKWSLLNM